MSDNQNSTQMDDNSGSSQRTESQMLDDILRNSDIMRHATGEEALPERHTDIPTPEQVNQNNDQPTQRENDEVSVPVEATDTGEDDTSTQEPGVYNLDDLDNFSVNVTIDGEHIPVSLDELVKGYATNQSLTNKGRELGDARKQLEAERVHKLGEIDSVLGAASQILIKAEDEASREYHSFEEEIQEARNDNDQYRLTELKDKQEQAQKKYWEARNEREQMVITANAQKNDIANQQWQAQLDNFSREITNDIPDWSPEVATEVRNFALNRGIPEDIINQMVDTKVIKFVDDFRRAEQARSQGAIKREAAPTKITPTKKGQTSDEKQNLQQQALADKVLSGQGSPEEQDAFLKGMVSKHFE